MYPLRPPSAPSRDDAAGRLGGADDPSAAGQATLELALVLPLVCGLFLLLVQVALVGRSQILVTHATREVARAVALEPGSSTAVDAARRAGGLDPAHLDMAVEPAGEPSLWAVRSRYRLPLVVPLLNIARREVTLGSRLVVRAEPE